MVRVDLGGRPEQIVDQRIDGVFHVAPGPGGDAEADALARLPSLPTTWPDVLELLGYALVVGDDLIEGIGDLADEARRLAGHAHGEIAHPHRLEGSEQLVKLAPLR